MTEGPVTQIKITVNNQQFLNKQNVDIRQIKMILSPKNNNNVPCLKYPGVFMVSFMMRYWNGCVLLCLLNWIQCVFAELAQSSRNKSDT